MSNKFELKAKIVKNDFGAVSAATMHDLKSALYVEAESIMTASKRYYVPVGETGNLKNSGTVTPPTESGNTVSVTLGYGGAAAPYAAIVHEKPKGWGQGRNKYLSQPLNIAVKGMGVRIGKALRISGNRRAI